ncbi:hypothetical protein KAR91_14875 [Candidatus Pacearchaeota archaeon]|nr:hypothetical protein [Candidatus Pacearchaeota archaeon]
MADSISITIEERKVEVTVLSPTLTQINLLEPVVLSSVALNTIHRLGDGSDHSDVALNTLHRAITAGDPHGSGLPTGGTTGDSTIKASAADFDFTILKNNLSAIIAPTVNDDSDAGFAVKSRWIDTVGLKVYECIAAPVGAAVWVDLSASGGGGGGGEWTEIARTEITSAVSAVEFLDVFTDDHDLYRVTIKSLGGLSAAFSFIDLQFGHGAGPTWHASENQFHLSTPQVTSAAYAGLNGSGSQTKIRIGNQQNNGTGREYYCSDFLITETRTTGATSLYGRGLTFNSQSWAYNYSIMGVNSQTVNAVSDHIRIFPSSGTISKGTIIVEGKNT